MAATAPVQAQIGVSGRFICRTGIIRRAEPIGFIQRGTHRLVDLQGRVIAALRSNRVNLFALEGRFVTVCGIDEGVIEGVRSILVTQVFPAGAPPGQVDLRTLLLLLFLFGFPSGKGFGFTPGLGTAGLGTSLGLGTGIGAQLGLQAGLTARTGGQAGL